MGQPYRKFKSSEEERLTNAALALPGAQRVRLAQRLWATLPRYVPADLSPEDLEAVYKRAAEIDSGEVKTVLWEDVLRELKAQ